jgi:hypothetical protein
MHVFFFYSYACMDVDRGGPLWYVLVGPLRVPCTFGIGNLLEIQDRRLVY